MAGNRTGLMYYLFPPHPIDEEGGSLSLFYFHFKSGSHSPVCILDRTTLHPCAYDVHYSLCTTAGQTQPGDETDAGEWPGGRRLGLYGVLGSRNMRHVWVYLAGKL